jgi:hypothetical protein
MRTLLIATLAATLVGCSCILPPQASMDACADPNGFGCFNRMADSQPVEQKPAPSKASSAKAGARSTAAAKKEEPSPAHVRDKPQLAEKKPAEKKTTPAIEAKVEAPPPVRPAETPDPVISKAKITIAAKLEDPTSAEFGEMKRAIRKNTLGQSVDTICGHVKGKTASGEDTGDRPFLYLVKEDDAYVVDGPPRSAAATAYRNICS